MRRRWRVTVGALAATLAVLHGCGQASVPPAPDAAISAPSPAAARPSPNPLAGSEAPPAAQPADPATLPASEVDEPAPTGPLGTRPLPLRPDGFGEVQPTPPELEDRRLQTVDLLPPPGDERFVAEVTPVPAEVLARSTWSPECPVAVGDLRYVTVAFWGFDDRPHTGELIVHATVASDLVEVFRRLHAARFPIEEMRVVRADELGLPPTGDGNNTSAFVCRRATASASWSRHAYGLALDLNPFHNPYVRDDLVIPELASAYADRSWRRPGMILAGDEATAAFADIGWAWGGDYRTLRDWMHFSDNGR